MKVSDSQHRLIEMMEILGITQTDIVRRTGVQKSSLSNYISGRRTPRQDQLSVIADPYGIDPAWLMGYDVDMYLQKSIQDQIAEAYTRNNFIQSITKEEINLIKSYRIAPPDLQAAVCTILNVKRDSLEIPLLPASEM